jgi:hypothetical protein
MNSQTPVVLLVLSMLAIGGCSQKAVDPGSTSTSSPNETGDAPGVTADASTQRSLGVELATVENASVEAQARGTATVIDSAAFAMAIADLESMRAEATVASDTEQRLENLYRDDGNASRQSVDAARQQTSSARARLTGAEARAALDWGAKLANATDASSARLRREVASGAVTLFRAEFPDALGAASDLKYTLLPARHAPLAVDYLDRSRAVAQFAAGDSVLLELRTQGQPDAAFRPSERVPIIATASGAARPLVPPAAAIAYQGRLWCYVARAANRFERIALDPDASSGQGYAADEAIKAGDQVVVHGAALLLSLERSASAEAGASAEQ